jgi:hypothetical protein
VPAPPVCNDLVQLDVLLTADGSGCPAGKDCRFPILRCFLLRHPSWSAPAPEVCALLVRSAVGAGRLLPSGRGGRRRRLAEPAGEPPAADPLLRRPVLPPVLSVREGGKIGEAASCEGAFVFFLFSRRYSYSCITSGDPIHERLVPGSAIVW